MIIKSAEAIKNAMCACGCDRRPDCADPLSEVASYQPEPGPKPEIAADPKPPKDVGSWAIRHGAADCWFIDSDKRERIVAAKRREDLEFIIHAIKKETVK